jgi:hypothetical protein
MRTPAEDPSPARWVGERLLRPWSGSAGGNPLGAIVPTGFDAYARIFPIVWEVPPEPVAGRPAPPESWKRLRWAEVAAINGRIAHPLMEWHLISTPAPGSAGAARSPQLTEPGGPPSEEELRDLAAVLREFTRTPELCWYCVWTGWGGIEQTESGVQIHHPLDRDYFVSFGQIEAVTSFEDHGPDIWWPDDRAWCVASDIDLAATYVGGSARCIDRLLAAEGLEALPVSVDDRVDSEADVINQA